MLRICYTSNPATRKHELHFDLDELDLHVQSDLYFFVNDTSFEPLDGSFEKGRRVLNKMLEGWLLTIEQAQEGKKRYLLVEVWDEYLGLLQIERKGSMLQCCYLLHWTWGAGAAPATFSDLEYVDETKLFLCYLPLVMLDSDWLMAEIKREMSSLIDELRRDLDKPPPPEWYNTQLMGSESVYVRLDSNQDFGLILSDVLVLYFIPDLLIRKDGLQQYRSLAANEGKSLVEFLNQWLRQWRKRVNALRLGQVLFIPIELSDTYIGGLEVKAIDTEALQLSYGFWANPQKLHYTAFEGKILDDVMLELTTTKDRVLSSLVLEVQ